MNFKNVISSFFKSTGKSLGLPFIAISFLVISFLALQTPREVLALPSCEINCVKDALSGAVGTACFVHGAYNVFGDEDYACLISNGGLTIAPAGTSYTDPCNFGNTSCAENSCVNPGSSADGAVCKIVESNGSGLSCNETVVSTGKWSTDRNECVRCDNVNHKPIERYGGTSGISTFALVNTEFLEICGADAACNDKKEDDPCSSPAGGTCNAVGQCVTTSALEVSCLPNSIEIGETSDCTFPKVSAVST